MQFCPTGLSGRLFYRTRLIHEAYVPFEPQIIVRDERIDLRAHGLRGHVDPTIGHTAGSISVVLEDSRVLAGDLLASGIFIGGVMLNGRPRRPPFEDDPRAVSQHLNRLLDQGARTFYVGHGGPVSAAAARRHAERLARLEPTPPFALPGAYSAR